MKHDKNTNFNNLQYSNIFSSRVYFAYNKTSSTIWQFFVYKPSDVHRNKIKERKIMQKEDEKNLNWRNK